MYLSMPVGNAYHHAKWGAYFYTIQQSLAKLHCNHREACVQMSLKAGSSAAATRGGFQRDSTLDDEFDAVIEDSFAKAQAVMPKVCMDWCAHGLSGGIMSCC